ncbi:MAG: hypothetical protein OQL19_20510 [Gammaproteobacteria bacterium]|nr:hypothetical protein [Gammaproteobacteria bacterium]
MKISIKNSGKKICWEINSQQTCKEYKSTIMGYEVLPENYGIIILEPYEDVGPNNAIIYNLDGTLRWKLPYTKESDTGICFDRIGFSNGKLTIIAIIKNRDVGFIVDWKNCKYLDIFSSR